MKPIHLSDIRAKARDKLHRHLFKGLLASHVVYYGGHAFHIPAISMGAAGAVLSLMLIGIAIGEEVH